MQFKIVALAALAAGASAQAVPSDKQASVLSVLLTALPPSALSLAATNSPAFESEMISSLAAGKTPDWYQALPTDVKSLLTQIYPASAPAATSAPETTAAMSSASKSAAAISSSISGGASALTNKTSVSTVTSASLTSGGGASSSGSAPATASSAGAYPTAVVGAGLAGAAGFIAMLAL